MAVDTFYAKGLYHGLKPVVWQILAKTAGQRQRVACLDAFAVEAQTKLAALLIQHPQVERDVVSDKQRIASYELKELPHCLLGGNSMFAQNSSDKP